MADATEAALARARWGRGIWLLAWAVLTAVQGAAVVAMVQGYQAHDAGQGGLGGVIGAGVGALAVQVLKSWLATRRLADLGRPADDAMWGLVPLMNAGLFVQLLAKAPSDALRAKRVRSWATQLSAVGALREAGGFLAPTAASGVAGAAVVALVTGLASAWFLEAMRAAFADGVDTVAQAAMLVAAASGLYTLVQLPKRDRASWASWAPSLLLMPALVVWGIATFGASASADVRAVLLGLMVFAWVLGPGAFAGGLAAALWLGAARSVGQGGSGGPGAALAALPQRVWDVVVVWGLRHQVVQVGGQLVIPGIWYGISWAFADLHAGLRPGHPAFARSVRLAAGVRGKLFKLLAAWFLASNLVSIAAGIVVQGPELAVAGLFDPTQVPASVVTLQQFLGALLGWWLLLAMWRIFLERDALLARKEAAAAEAHATP